jgi:DNA-binding NarL/FixJ family response regulator
MHTNAVYLREALNAGGSGYVLKSSAAEELGAAIRSVLKGKIYVARAFGRDVLDSLRSPLGSQPRSSIALTDRQS